MPALPPSLYIHVPYCSGKCHYCAFHSQAIATTPSNYLEQTLSHLAGTRWHTIYIGGGTPSLLGTEGFKAFSKLDIRATEEFTVELHPATTTPELIDTLADCGVNRLSIGVQSFDDATLKRCNRRHTAQQALTAIATARRVIPDTGIDLIAALPGVSHEQWLTTLERALDLDLPHYSIYTLTIEPASAWQNETPPDDDLAMDAIAIAAHQLATHGLLRYETSNYARPGFECKHNLRCWLGGDYLGVGPSAASRLGLTRQTLPNPPTTVTPLEDALERAMTHLRLNTGFNLERIITDYPILQPYREIWSKRLAIFQRSGLLDSHHAPTTRGYEVLDAITRTLLQIED